jgi:hypothetical protein
VATDAQGVWRENVQHVVVSRHTPPAPPVLL